MLLQYQKNTKALILGHEFLSPIWPPVFANLCVYFFLFQAVHKVNIYCYDHSWVVPYYGESYLHLKRFYSPSNSFLKIEPKSKPLSCGSSTEIRVHYILTPEAVGEQKKITFYYLVSLHLPYSEIVTGNDRGIRNVSCGLWQKSLNIFDMLHMFFRNKKEGLSWE